MIGKRFKSLTVISLDEERNSQLKRERKLGIRSNAPAYYICKCDCGNILSLQKAKIQNRKEYGCVQCKKTDFKKYVGKKINSWTILEYFEEERKFLCKCECGNIREVYCYNLINNQSKDCGCGRKNTVSKMMSIESLIGCKFGKLTVIDEIGKNKYGKTICRCKCECGNEVDVLSNSLRTGHTLSCGCIKSYQPSRIKMFLNNLGYKVETEKRINIYGEISYICFDIFVEELNLAIEYDGKPHFIPIDWAGKGIEWAVENLEYTQYRDKIKDEYCYKNNIYLLRIPFTAKDNIEELIKETIDIILKNNHRQRLNEKGLS